MKRIFIFLVVILFIFGTVYGTQVGESKARTVGQNFLVRTDLSMVLKNSPVLDLVYTSTSVTGMAGNTSVTCFYVFTLGSGQGFVIVAGDDKSTPVLGYSADRSFDAGNIPPHVASWLQWYEKEIVWAIENDIQVSDQVQTSWRDLLSGNITSDDGNTRSVTPLLQTQWDQSPNYNALCPFDNQYQQYTVTGCVATAMAQVMKFWNEPATGSGFHSYNTNNFGTLSADFGSTTYDWGSMPASLSGANSAVATLMYHCGVSVDMSYGVGQTGGSSAYVVTSQSPTQNCTEYAMKTYFGFKPSLSGQMRDNYSLSSWISKLKSDLDGSRPVIYAGIGDGGGHCFVCDGYDQSDYFHFNWGWSGQYDGYFQIDALNPNGVGTGGGTGGFNSYQQAIFGVEPMSTGGGTTTNDLRLYAQVEVSANSIYYGGAFNITASVGNFGLDDFHGDYCVAIFDNDDVFIGMVDSAMSQVLQSGYYNTYTFSTNGLLTMTPGTYTMGVYFRPAGSNWFLVADGQYSNYITMTVSHSNDIELYAPMTVTPGNMLTRGQPVGVHLDVLNNGATTFNGTFDVSLYDLEGYPVFTIDQYTNQSLPSGYHYTNGLDFYNDYLDLTPGTYLLAIQYKPDGNAWELTGSTYYQNPVRITVQQDELEADIYEPNNTVAQSYNLPVTFTGSGTTITTEGSNCHNGIDYDLYKIDLPQGYSYSVGARLFDANFGNNGQTYSLDAIFVYSTDGVNASDVYDEMIQDNILMMNGGTVWFQVAPKYTGQTGTYLLSINIGKYPQGIDAPSGVETITVYPNPASEAFSVDLSGFHGNVSGIRLINLQGETVPTVNPVPDKGRIHFNVGDLPDGLYFLNMMLDSGMLSKRIVIRK